MTIVTVYNKQIDITLKRTPAPADKPSWGGDHYTAIASTDQGTIQFDYYDSIYNMINKIDAHPVDALWCYATDAMASIDNPSWREFADDFGYDPEDDEQKAVWNGCRKALRALRFLGLTTSDIEKLAEDE